MSRYNSYGEKSYAWLGWFAALAVLLLIGSCVRMTSFRMERGTFTVKEKSAVTNGNSHTYLIFTDKTTYEIDDTLWKWRWNSSDVYGKMEVGKTYEADLQGVRWPFFSMYQNILNPVEVTKGVEEKN
jgi:hypothetical protein